MGNCERSIQPLGSSSKDLVFTRRIQKVSQNPLAPLPKQTPPSPQPRRAPPQPNLPTKNYSWCGGLSDLISSSLRVSSSCSSRGSRSSEVVFGQISLMIFQSLVRVLVHPKWIRKNPLADDPQLSMPLHHEPTTTRGFLHTGECADQWPYVRQGR